MSLTLSQVSSAPRCSLRTERTETCVAVLCHTYVQNISTKGTSFLLEAKKVLVWKQMARGKRKTSLNCHHCTAWRGIASRHAKGIPDGHKNKVFLDFSEKPVAAHFMPLWVAPPRPQCIFYLSFSFSLPPPPSLRRGAKAPRQIFISLARCTTVLAWAKCPPQGKTQQVCKKGAPERTLVKGLKRQSGDLTLCVLLCPPSSSSPFLE